MFAPWAVTGETTSSSPTEHPAPSPSLWLAYVKLDEPPGLSPVTTVGRFATAEEALLATDAIRTSR